MYLHQCDLEEDRAGLRGRDNRAVGWLAFVEIVVVWACVMPWVLWPT